MKKRRWRRSKKKTRWCSLAPLTKRRRIERKQRPDSCAFLLAIDFWFVSGLRVEDGASSCRRFGSSKCSLWCENGARRKRALKKKQNKNHRANGREGENRFPAPFRPFSFSSDPSLTDESTLRVASVEPPLDLMTTEGILACKRSSKEDSFEKKVVIVSTLRRPSTIGEGDAQTSSFVSALISLF